MNISNKILPVLTLRDVIIFPGAMAPIFIGRKKSFDSLLAAKETEDGQYILITTQKKQVTENPTIDELYNVGVLARIVQTVRLPNDNAKIIIEALERVKLTNFTDQDIYTANYQIITDAAIKEKSLLSKMSVKLIELFEHYLKYAKKTDLDILDILDGPQHPAYITNIIASQLVLPLEIKQYLLTETNIQNRAEKLIELINKDLTRLNTDQVVQKRVKKQIEKSQKEFYLNEQMKAIQQEMDGDNHKSDFADLEQKIKKLKLSAEAKEKAESELKKLKMMNQMSAEYSVVRNYLEVLLAMPWGKKKPAIIDIEKAENTLDRDHYGLKKVKERIIEYLSVLTRAKKIKGPILCLIGPPGVGKTSLAKSIAESMGREYSKFALGGVRDEAEIRGHRKTYLGSMPGKVINLLKKTKTDNPVMLLDEIDKMSNDFRGDPASALLEVLDPEQNAHFVDHYLEVEYDLSNIIFIATANSYDLPPALADRMEIINVSGYIEDEKLQIAKNHLVTKQLKSHNVDAKEFHITDAALLELIRYYTKEAGVRALEREIGSLTRKALTKILKDPNLTSITITPENIEEYLGVRKYSFGIAEEKNQIGATTGLAYTQFGGELLTIEAVNVPGKGQIKATGKLGDVMKESAEAAYSCLLANAKRFNIAEKDLKDRDIHLHVPEGAIPKDGPSAGIAIFTTLVSLLTQIPVNKEIAMTGEITLRGKILPIGGLKEKMLAAKRGTIKTILIPKENVKDLKDIPENVKDNLQIIPVGDVDEVLKHALTKKLSLACE